MAEIGLVRFAKCALAIATKVLPLYRSKYSKHTFTQPVWIKNLNRGRLEHDYPMSDSNC